MTFKESGSTLEQTHDAERGITSVSGGERNQVSADFGKKIAFSAGIVFLGLIAFLQWSPTEKQTDTDSTNVTRRIKSNNQFQPAEIAEPRPGEAAPATPDIETDTVTRIDQYQQAVEITQAERLYEASKRAPLMAFSGDRSTLVQPASSGISEDNFSGLNVQGIQQRGASLAANLEGSLAAKGSLATALANPHLTITQGTIIPCVLNTAMNSTQPGLVSCTITDDIYSTTGTVILLEKGSRVVGEYRGGLQRGTPRIFVIWTRAETPNGVVVTLASPGTDSLGRSGFDGNIDSQFWTRFGGTIMLSIVGSAFGYVASNTGDSVEDTIKTDQWSELVKTELERTINVPILLRKNQGEEVAIMVSRDLDFSGVYRLRAR